MRKSSWKTCGLTTYRFVAHNGQFPWPERGVTITNPEQALLWTKTAKATLPTERAPVRPGRRSEPRPDRPLARVLPNCSSPIRSSW